ncbi:MAG TPA: tetratricopeptide repeat protein, partial [Saprospiraceae bacterium]|nr:tetratricopeptide repeat protein [Saprospiraceae bacterium]
GRLHQTMLQSDSSLLYLEKFATLLPNSALAHNMLGISYGDMNLFLKSKNEFNFAIHLDSTFKESYANLIYIYTKINQADSALYIARNGLRINPQFIGLRNNLADLYLQLDSLEEAKVIIDSTLRLDSSNLGTLMLNGQYWYKLGRFESAQKMFQAVLKLKPDYQTAGLFNVLTLKTERKYSELMKFLKQMLEMDSTNLSFNFELAVCYNMTQQFDKAGVLFAKIIQLGKDHPEKFELLGDVYYFYLNQPEQSEKCYLQALQADSFNIELLSKLSVNLIHLCKYDSLPLLLHLLDKYPNNTIYREYYNMALLVAKGQINIAEPLIDKLIQANHELRWRIYKDPLMNTLVSVPEIKSKLTM